MYALLKDIQHVQELLFRKCPSCLTTLYSWLLEENYLQGSIYSLLRTFLTENHKINILFAKYKYQKTEQLWNICQTFLFVSIYPKLDPFDGIQNFLYVHDVIWKKTPKMSIHASIHQQQILAHIIIFWRLYVFTFALHFCYFLYFTLIFFLRSSI